jgi:hypothetical protein
MEVDSDIAAAVVEMFSYVAKLKAACEHDPALRRTMEANPLVGAKPPRAVLARIDELVGPDRLAELRDLRAAAATPGIR